MKIRYTGVYDAVEVALPGQPIKRVRRGEEIDVDDVELATGLCEGGFEKVGVSVARPAPTNDDEE